MALDPSIRLACRAVAMLLCAALTACTLEESAPPAVSLPTSAARSPVSSAPDGRPPARSSTSVAVPIATASTGQTFLPAVADAASGADQPDATKTGQVFLPAVAGQRSGSAPVTPKSRTLVDVPNTTAKPSSDNARVYVPAVPNRPGVVSIPSGETSVPSKPNPVTPSPTPTPPDLTSTIPSSAVQGSVVIENGRCCAGGTAGTVVTLTVAFTATSTQGHVREMRVWRGCPTQAGPDAPAWEPFVTTKTYTTTLAHNWTGWYIAAQYRDTQGNLSPIYCDDISLEGMPALRP